MAQHRSEKPFRDTYTGRRWIGTMSLLLALVLALIGWHVLTRYDGLPGYLGLLLVTVSAVGALVAYEWSQR